MSRHRRHDDEYDDDSPPARSGAGPFGWGFGIAAGVIVAALLIFVGLPLLCCLGGLGGLIGIGRTKAVNDAAAIEKAAQVKQPPPGHVPVDEAPDPAGRQQDDHQPPLAKDKAQVPGVFAIPGLRITTRPIVKQAPFHRNKRTLWVYLTLYNESDTKKITYMPWGNDAGAEGADLADNLGNHYARMYFRPPLAGQSVGRQSIYPRKNVGDLIVFEAPVDEAKELTLWLPLLDVDAHIKIRIPMSMVHDEDHETQQAAAAAARQTAEREKREKAERERMAAERQMKDEENRKAVAEKKRQAAAAKQAAKDEEAAHERLKYAKALIDKGDDAEARRRLEKLIADLPDTNAAAEAKDLLKKLDK